MHTKSGQLLVASRVTGSRLKEARRRDCCSALTCSSRPTKPRDFRDRSNAQASAPRRRTCAISGACSSLGLPTRSLLLVRTSSEVPVAPGFRNPSSKRYWTARSYRMLDLCGPHKSRRRAEPARGMSTLLGQQWILDADREKPATDSNALSRFADSRTGAQAGLSALLGPVYLSASQMVQANFACQSSLPPRQRGNAKLSEFCDRWLDTRIGSALAAEGNHSPNSVALWARADRTLTDQAPLVRWPRRTTSTSCPPAWATTNTASSRPCFGISSGSGSGVSSTRASPGHSTSKGLWPRSTLCCCWDWDRESQNSRWPRRRKLGYARRIRA
jgi:hypothetical protein